MWKWLAHKIKEHLGLAELEKEIKELKGKVKDVETTNKYIVKHMKQFTKVDADLGFHGNNTIIVTGYYRNRPYVQIYDVGTSYFRKAVEELRDLRRHSIVRNVDLPNGLYINDFETLLKERHND